jgi:HK97 family phage major capsid protein
LIDAAGDKALSAEDVAKYDTFMAEAKGCKDQLDRLATLEAEQRAAEEDADRVIVPPAARANRPADVPDEFVVRRTEAQRIRHAVSQPQYRDAFWRGIRRSWAGIEDAERRALQVGTDSEGGYLVPDEFERTLVQGLTNPVVMRSLGATVLTGVSGEREVPFVSSHGSASWTAEEANASESDEAFGSRKIGAHKLTRIMKVSVELLQDSAFNLESYISSEFIRAFGAAEDTAFIAGNGAMRPRGLTLDGTAGVTAAAVDAVTVDELIQLKYALGRAYRPRAVWLAADATVGAISRLKDGNGQYLWRPGITVGDPDTLLGRPFVTSDDVPTMATGNKAIWFGDPAYYYIVDRAGINFQILRELYAVSGQVGFLAYKRTDGRLILDASWVYVTMA